MTVNGGQWQCRMTVSPTARSFLFAYIIGTFSNMINTLTADNDEFDAKMREVGELMRFHSVPRRLHEQVLEFYEFKFSSKVKRALTPPSAGRIKTVRIEAERHCDGAFTEEQQAMFG